MVRKKKSTEHKSGLVSSWVSVFFNSVGIAHASTIILYHQYVHVVLLARTDVSDGVCLNVLHHIRANLAKLPLITLIEDRVFFVLGLHIKIFTITRLASPPFD